MVFAAADVEIIRDSLALLAATDDMDALLQGCAESIVARLDATAAQVWLVDPRSEVLEVRASAGSVPLAAASQSRVAMGEQLVGAIARKRRSLITNDVAGDERLPITGDAEMTSFAGSPMTVGTRLVGVMLMFSRSDLASSTTAALESVAAAIATGVERIQASERTRDVLERLHSIGSALVSELDSERVVQVVTDSATELTRAAFGAFFYNVYDARGGSYMLYSLSGAPRSAFEQFPLPSKTAVFAPTFDGDATVRMDDATIDPRFGHSGPYHGMPPGHLPVRSYLATPVLGRDGSVLGGLFFGHPDPGRFSVADERIVEGIAKYASVALSNARTYQQQQSIASVLQHSLLPTVPQVPGPDIAASYLPASNAAAVGGDWFDVVSLNDGRVTLTIGDVAGHDIVAASHMGVIRSVLRAYSLDGNAPGEALRMLDRHLDAIGAHTLVTVVHGSLDVRSGELSLASAGHLPVLVIPAVGSPRYVRPEQRNTPLGVGLNENALAADVFHLEPNDAIVFFTDGLVERRGHALEDQLEALRRIVEGHADVTVGRLKELLLTSGLTELDDDVALLIVRRLPAPDGA